MDIPCEWLFLSKFSISLDPACQPVGDEGPISRGVCALWGKHAWRRCAEEFERERPAKGRCGAEPGEDRD